MKKTLRQSSTYQILFGDSIVPACVPFYYRLYLLVTKMRRSAQNRSSRRKLLLGAEQKETSSPETNPACGNQNTPLINKTFRGIDQDLGQEDVKATVRRLEELKAALAEKGLRCTSAAGSFKNKDFVPAKERNKTWENAWVLCHSGVKPGDDVLDLGGASTIFSFFLASKGCRVTCVDNDWGCHGIIYNARFVAKKMRWPLSVLNRDLGLDLPFPSSSFDKIFCVCVLEHLTSPTRRKVMAEIRRVLKPGGIVGLTFDYDEKRNDPRFDKGLRYSLREKLWDDVIAPSGLKICGNQELVDDCPSDFFLGALFLEKR